MKSQITGLVNTRNAAATLDLCLASMQRHVDELIVVDMDSSDGTVDIARSFGARVLTHEPLPYVEPARAYGIEHATNEWILILDADEVLPRTLGDHLRSIAAQDEADVVVIGWRNYLFGGATEHGPFAPTVDRHRRFFRKGMLVHSPALHVPPTPTPSARELVLSIEPELCVSHFAYADISEWLARSDRYTTIEARDKVEQGAGRPRTSSVMAASLRTFLRGYLRQRGYRDGWRGFHTSLLLAHYQLIAGLKTQQLREVGSAAQVTRRYREIAQQLIDS